jgi:hypothetical protein
MQTTIHHKHQTKRFDMFAFSLAFDVSLLTLFCHFFFHSSCSLYLSFAIYTHDSLFGHACMKSNLDPYFPRFPSLAIISNRRFTMRLRGTRSSHTAIQTNTPCVAHHTTNCMNVQRFARLPSRTTANRE